MRVFKHRCRGANPSQLLQRGLFVLYNTSVLIQIDLDLR
jgi:hypothetical protein